MDDVPKIKSERWAPLKCLANVALLFAPIAIALGLLVMVTSGSERDVDPVLTGTVRPSR